MGEGCILKVLFHIFCKTSTLWGILGNLNIKKDIIKCLAIDGELVYFCNDIVLYSLILKLELCMIYTRFFFLFELSSD